MSYACGRAPLRLGVAAILLAVLLASRVPDPARAFAVPAGSRSKALTAQCTQGFDAGCPQHKSIEVT